MWNAITRSYRGWINLITQPADLITFVDIGNNESGYFWSQIFKGTEKEGNNV